MLTGGEAQEPHFVAQLGRPEVRQFSSNESDVLAIHGWVEDGVKMYRFDTAVRQSRHSVVVLMKLAPQTPLDHNTPIGQQVFPPRTRAVGLEGAATAADGSVRCAGAGSERGSRHGRSERV
jgi:hypothetical protein